MKFKTEWRISAWTWDGEEYIPAVIRNYELYEDAQRDFDGMNISNDMPQIDILRVDFVFDGCWQETGHILLDRKE